MLPTDNIDLMYWMGLLIGLLGTFTGILIAWAIYRAFRRKAQVSYGGLVIPEQQFAGRKKEIIRLKRQILTGHSSAIVSMFSKDRTTLLSYLSDPSNSKELYGELAENFVFSLLDINLLLLNNCGPTQFWERALKPLEEKMEPNSPLFQIYQACQQNQFDEYSLDRLIVQLKQEGWRLVLMLDRFDELFNSNLDNPAFFATLRNLASSRSPSSLSLIISGNILLKQFHEQIRDLNPNGSPYLNFMESGEIVLGSLSDSEADELLRQMFFSKPERQFIKEIAGLHPHFIQLAASALQAAKENQEQQPLEIAKKDFYDRIENMLTHIIHSWNPAICQAIVSLVKENQAPDFFNDEEELSLLEKQGFVMKDSHNQWQVSPGVLVDFIHDKTEQELCNH